MSPPESPTPLPGLLPALPRRRGAGDDLLRVALRALQGPFRHVVIDDGSLTPADRDRLLGRFGGMTILSRAEQDERTLPLLKNHPNCRKFRTEQYFALKLIDPPLQAGGAFALCDGDILFVRDFRGIDRRSEPGQDLVAMCDWTSAYYVPFRRGPSAAPDSPPAEHQRGDPLRRPVHLRPRLRRVAHRPRRVPPRLLHPGADDLGGTRGPQAAVPLRPLAGRLPQRPGRVPAPGRRAALHPHPPRAARPARVSREGLRSRSGRGRGRRGPGRAAGGRPGPIDDLVRGSMTRSALFRGRPPALVRAGVGAAR